MADYGSKNGLLEIFLLGNRKKNGKYF